MGPRLLACAALLVAASPAAAETGGVFRDWTLVCSPGLRCEAATFAEGREGVIGFALTRAADADAPLLLQLRVVVAPTVSGDVVFGIDGGDVLTLPAATFFAAEDGGLATSNAGVRAALLPRLRDGARVEVAAVLDGKPVRQVFSLAGLVATLRKMDEDQSRIGTPTALIDRGDKALPDRAGLPQDVATADDLPAPVRAIWQAGGCADRDTDNPGDLGFSVPFGSDTRLFVLVCGMPGAYNFPSRIYQYTSGAQDADVVPLPGMGTDGPTADMTAWNVDLTGDRLTSFFKGRGIGDCGQLATWRLDPERGAPVLVEARSKDDCDGEGGDPDAWPRVWPKG